MDLRNEIETLGQKYMAALHAANAREARWEGQRLGFEQAERENARTWQPVEDLRVLLEGKIREEGDPTRIAFLESGLIAFAIF